MNRDFEDGLFAMVMGIAIALIIIFIFALVVT
jgi:hypothetical protein